MRTAPLPIHFRQKVPQGPQFFGLTQTISDLKLNTVCEEAKCPNRTDCYARGTLTLQILGKICTRRCGFCAEITGRPRSLDRTEPERVVDAIRRLKLSHVVITAPARDDLDDSGASIFAETVGQIRKHLPGVTVEILTSDLNGNEKDLRTVFESHPDIFNHNMETVRRLTPKVRSKATYERSLKVLRSASKFFGSTKTKIKSGVMVGLGETLDELAETFRDMSRAGVQYLTVGQYLQPTLKHLPVEKFYLLDEFKTIKRIAGRASFEKIFCGPLVRSSYHADEMIANVF